MHRSSSCISGCLPNFTSAKTADLLLSGLASSVGTTTFLSHRTRCSFRLRCCCLFLRPPPLHHRGARLRLTVDGRFPDLSLFPIPCLMTTLCVRQTPTSKKYKEVVIYRTMLLVLGRTTMLSIRWMLLWTLNQQTTLTTSQRS